MHHGGVTTLSSTSDFARLSRGRIPNNKDRYNYGPGPYRGWRLSSSWGRWNSQWDGSCHQDAKDRRGDAAAWSRTYEKLEKDTADLYELIKKRIDADPFDALFGRSFLYPNRARATWWGVRGGTDGSQEGLKAPIDGGKPGKAADADIIKKQQADRSSPLPRGSSKQHEAASSGESSPAGRSHHTEDYEIDPITMRKVPKKSTNPTSGTPVRTNTRNKTFDIPVKRFNGTSDGEMSCQLSDNKQALQSNLTNCQRPNMSSDSPKEMSQPDWLAREGFGHDKDARAAKPKVPDSAARISPRIESTLERRTPRRSSASDKSKARFTLMYDVEENRTEDIDLLRASDIRAASGTAARMRRHLELRKHEDRMRLEAEYTALQRMEAIELEWKKELAASKKQLQVAEARKREEASNAHLEKEVSAQKAAMEALEMRRAGDGTASATSTRDQPEQGEGDMASNVHEFAQRERWYKNKAPHATEIEEQKMAHFAKARSLVREIRDIYEDRYGVIDSKHRQPEETVSDTQGQGKETPLTGLEKGPGAPPEEARKVSSRGPLSTKERIGTMLQQLLDDSRYLQKLLRTSESIPQMREELFQRNRSMQNASEAIAEALSLNASQNFKKHAIVPGQQSVVAGRQQVVQPALSPGNVRKQSSVYSVLAYDASNLQVTAAEMSSSSESACERRLSLSEALSSLTEPAKFLPQLTKLQSEGYEIVSSDTNILVLRKVYKAPSSNPYPPPFPTDEKAVGREKEGPRKMPPADGMTRQPENLGSPPGSTSDGSGQPGRSASEAMKETLSGHKVRREEDVFSGSSRKRWDDKIVRDRTKRKSRHRGSSRRWRTTKRMLWVASWTAGCCYAVGAVTEFLRA